MDLETLAQDLGAVAWVVVAILVGLLLHVVVYRVAGRVVRSTSATWDESFVEHTRNAAGLLFAAGAVLVTLPFAGGDEEALLVIRHAAIFAGIIGIGWFVVGLTLVAYDLVMARYPVDVEDNLEARTIGTQLTVLQRFGAILVWVLATGLALLTIPGVMPLAASLLAGAGVIGIVLGVAAGPLIGNLIAGIQIAFTQPIRIDDVVVIEGEWGRIEEITAAYVVVSIWDKRRLIVPLSRIVETPVENWTRRSSDLLGTVYLHADYRAPVDAIRAELLRILEASGRWDGEVASVLVTDAGESTITIRALVSGPDSGTIWELRCLVREKLIAFLQERHPEALPVQREIQQQVAATEAG